MKRRVYSHPAGFESCKQFLQLHDVLKNVERSPASSTSKGAEMVKIVLNCRSYGFLAPFFSFLYFFSSKMLNVFHLLLNFIRNYEFFVFFLIPFLFGMG